MGGQIVQNISSNEVNGKSIMGLLMLAAGPGSKLRIVCTGIDCQTALTQLCALVDAKFGED